MELQHSEENRTKRVRKPPSRAEYFVDTELDKEIVEATVVKQEKQSRKSKETLGLLVEAKSPSRVSKRQKTTNESTNTQNTLPIISPLNSINTISDIITSDCADQSAQPIASTASPDSLEVPQTGDFATEAKEKKRGGRKKKEQQEWGPDKLKAFQALDSNPNAYYFRFKGVGEEQKTGPWSEEEKQLFLQRVKEVGVSGQWGLFSMGMPGRVGYQCLAFYRKLVEGGELEPNEGMVARKQKKKEKKTHTPKKLSKPIVSDQFPAQHAVYPVQVRFTNSSLNHLDLCVFCGALGNLEDLLFCLECGDCFHHFCLDPPIILTDEKKLNWRCAGCKICEVCKDLENEDQLIVCDVCDSGFHTFCIGLPGIPEGNSWICNTCVKCKSCGSKSPGPEPDSKWMCDYTRCTPCGVFFSKGCYCPVCEKVYRPDDTETPMVQCDSCDKWVHIDCDSIDNARYLRMSSEDLGYECPKCRGETSIITPAVPINEVAPVPTTASSLSPNKAKLSFLLNESATAAPIQTKDLLVQNVSNVGQACSAKEFIAQEFLDNRVCMFCQKPGEFGGEGRLLSADVDQWVHSNCALWSNECWEAIDGGLINVTKALHRAKTTKCSLCEKNGGTIGCNTQGCPNTYHFTCARESNAVFHKQKTCDCNYHATHKDVFPPETPLTRRLYVFQNHRKPGSKSTSIGQNVNNRVGSLIVHSFGKINFENSLFHDETIIYPIDYTIRRRYWSMNGIGRSEYNCIIKEKDGSPSFIIESVENPDIKFSSSTPLDCFDQLRKVINDSRSRTGLPSIGIYRGPATGLQFFGLSESWITASIESLPNSIKCTKYQFQFINPATLHTQKNVNIQEEQPVEELPENPTGCARTEVFQKGIKSRAFEFKVLSDGRVNSRMGGRLKQAEDTLRKSSNSAGGTFRSELPDAMKYRQYKMKTPKIRVMKSKIHSYGVFAMEDMEEGEMIIEYVGEIIGKCVADKREKIYEKSGIIGGCYMFKIHEDMIVDATYTGNQARFINHSCEPNAYTKIIEAEDTWKIMIMAKRRIVAGEEIAYDYQFPLEDIKIPCHCGASKCKGFMN